MSHEIRTPMNAIIGLDTLALHDDTISDQTRDYLEKIGGSARHLLGLINDILDMSRIESGRLVLRNEEFSFSAILEQINTMVMAQCRDKGLTYECRVLTLVDDFYIGDDTKRKEVLINILSNAIKFTEAPGSVTLTVERTAVFDNRSTLRFRIKDTGIGMDKEFIPKIFEAFSQENSGRKNKYGSTGLGMAITKSIVEMMDGTIDVESEKGVGTEFIVTVTLKNSERQKADRENAIDPGSLHVLVVDDDEVAAEHARMVLGEVGIRADVCTSGAEALRMMEVQHTKQEPYNLVLMDWNMPEMNGLEASGKIREQFSNCFLPGLLITTVSGPISLSTPSVSETVGALVSSDSVSSDSWISVTNRSLLCLPMPALSDAVPLMLRLLAFSALPYSAVLFPESGCTTDSPPLLASLADATSASFDAFIVPLSVLFVDSSALTCLIAFTKVLRLSKPSVAESSRIWPAMSLLLATAS